MQHGRFLRPHADPKQGYSLGESRGISKSAIEGCLRVQLLIAENERPGHPAESSNVREEIEMVNLRIRPAAFFLGVIVKFGGVRFILRIFLLLLVSRAPLPAAENAPLSIDASEAGAKIDRNLFGRHRHCSLSQGRRHQGGSSQRCGLRDV
jgi:hypothetical protein